jgi:hypothetical protein
LAIRTPRTQGAVQSVQISTPRLLRICCDGVFGPAHLCALSFLTKTRESRLMALTTGRVPISQATCAIPSSIKSWVQKRGSDYSADTRKSFAHKAVSPCRRFWPRALFCASVSAIVPRVGAFARSESDHLSGRRCGLLPQSCVTETRGDLGSIDAITTDVTSARQWSPYRLWKILGKPTPGRANNSRAKYLGDVAENLIRRTIDFPIAYN